MSIKSDKVRYDYLEELATILETADEEHAKKNEPGYTQVAYVHPCGTPGCALGHWAVAHPDRWVVNPSQERVVSRNISGISPFSSAVIEFGITFHEAEELFGGGGCDHAETAKEAAAYVRVFIADKKDRSNIDVEIL